MRYMATRWEVVGKWILGEYSENGLLLTFDYSHMLIPPRGFSIAGVYGSVAQWLDGFGLIITR